MRFGGDDKERKSADLGKFIKNEKFSRREAHRLLHAREDIVFRAQKKGFTQPPRLRGQGRKTGHEVRCLGVPFNRLQRRPAAAAPNLF